MTGKKWSEIIWRRWNRAGPTWRVAWMNWIITLKKEGKSSLTSMNTWNKILDNWLITCWYNLKCALCMHSVFLTRWIGLAPRSNSVRLWVSLRRWGRSQFRTAGKYFCMIKTTISTSHQFESIMSWINLSNSQIKCHYSRSWSMRLQKTVSIIWDKETTIIRERLL